jgi:hypothetical protein
VVVSRNELSARERAAVFALLGTARKVSNPELREMIGFPLEGKARRNLNERKLVESEKQGRAFVHELSDKGWRWCADELAAGPAGQSGSAERAHYLVFGMFSRYLNATGLGLADIANAKREPRDDDAASVTARVEDEYRTLAPADGAFVKIRELRARLTDIPRTDLDAALTALFSSQRINLIPQSNQQALSDEDRESALRIGGEYKHLISIERLA